MGLNRLHQLKDKHEKRRLIAELWAAHGRATPADQELANQVAERFQKDADTKPGIEELRAIAAVLADVYEIPRPAEIRLRPDTNDL